MTIYEPIEELNDEIRAARQFVQNIKDESHMKQRKRAAEIKENKTANRQNVRHHTLDDRLLRTLHGSMAFGCLVAIDKAYADRNKIERRKKLTTQVEQARQEHSFVNAQIQVKIRFFELETFLFSSHIHRFRVEQNFLSSKQDQKVVSEVRT